jgi:hypothetical protein
MPGTNPSQTPEAGLSVIGMPSGCQLLNAPVTLTRRAFGAHTENATPSVPETVRR